jgi:hypothetical protein
MNDAQIKRILQTTRTIAVVGLSSNSAKASYSVASYMKSQGYHVIPVNPNATEVFGEKAYPDLLSVPDKVDLVQLFRPSAAVPPFVEQAIQIGAKAIWMQSGIWNDEAAARARAAGLDVVMDRCMSVEHRRLFGEG